MGQAGIFTNSSNQMLSSMSGLISILSVVAVIAGVLFFLTSMANMMRGQQIDITQIISSFLVSGIIIGLGTSVANSC